MDCRSEAEEARGLLGARLGGRGLLAVGRARTVVGPHIARACSRHVSHQGNLLEQGKG